MFANKVHDGPSLDVKQSEHPPKQTLISLVGLFYLLGTLVGSTIYLGLLAPSMTNDFWWFDYTLTKTQAFLIDLANTHLSVYPVNHRPPSWNLSFPPLDQSYVTTLVSLTYPRRLVYNELTTVEYAITNLREMEMSWSVWMFAQYCWVDFNQHFELAHTLKRQKRCKAYRDNGAMYVESLLRNINYNDFITMYGGPGYKFTVSIQLALEASALGQEWLRTTSTASTTIPQEVVYWQSKGITKYILQWQNQYQISIVETISIENALGWLIDVVVKDLPSAVGPATSLMFYWCFINDMYLMNILNMSMVRNASNHFSNYMEFESLMQLYDDNRQYVNQTGLVHNLIGPFLSIDTFYTPIPSSLIGLHQNYMQWLWGTLQDVPQLFNAFITLPSTTIPTPVPNHWRLPNTSYYGGNPLCLSGQPKGFIQTQLSFDDACSIQAAMTTKLAPTALLFTNFVSTPLQLCPVPACEAIVSSVAAFASSHLPPPAMQDHVQNVVSDVVALNVSLIQFATIEKDWRLLHHKLFQDANWASMAWLLLFDWAQGAREVVSVEGDENTFVLISEPYEPRTYDTSSGTIQHATQILYYLILYTTVVLIAVGVGAAAFVVSSRKLILYNILQFNRVAGSVWVGRPLLLLRGMTAVLILSTAQVEMQDFVGYSAFKITQRPLWQSVIVAGETTWISYVFHEFLFVPFRSTACIYGPLSANLAWLIVVLLDVFMPVEVSATLSQSCSGVDMDHGLVCSSGLVKIGSWDRLVLLLGLHIACSSIICFVSIAVKSHHTIVQKSVANNLDKLLSGASVVLLERGSKDELDQVSYFLGGVIMFNFWGQRVVFDLTHWVLSTTSCSFSPVMPTSPKQKKAKWKKYPRVEAACGLVYVFLTMLGSISYLQLSQINLSNDFFWAGLNATGINPALMTWFRDQWIYSDLDNAVINLNNVSLLGLFSDDTSVDAPATMGSQAQMTLLSTPTQAITGLRSAKEVCEIAWMFTQYCYVDFQHTWSLANSAKRALRCSKMTSNGAIYLEAVVRNIDWAPFQACWGDAFDTGVAAELQTTTAGKLWLTKNLVLDGFPSASIADEVKYWNENHITQFNIQWQNYQKVGIIHTYSIIGALNYKAHFSIQSDGHVNTRHSQTSMKLYWAFANDLNLVAANSSRANSLVRGSSNFIFQNTSIALNMANYGYINSPLSAGLTAVESFFGPFGSIDTFYVPCPSEVRAAFSAIMTALNDALRQNTKAQSMYMNIKLCAYITPAPATWANDYAYGGSLLCDQALHPNPMKQSLLALFSRDEICRRGDPFVTILRPNRPQLVIATMMARLLDPATNLTAICSLDLFNGGNICVGYLSATIAFIQTYFKNTSEFGVLTTKATNAINQLDIKFMQYGAVNASSPIQIYHLSLLAEPNFTFFSWLFIYQWVLGNREVISFQGDNAGLTLLSEVLTPSVKVIETSELPINFATYARSGVFYVTGVLLAVSSAVVIYAAASRGFIEARNLFELNRVAGIVWVGRPLLALRSLTAVLLLSTATLDLQADGILAVFNVMAMPWYKTVLSAAEVTWLVYIMNDIAIVIAASYTKYYAPANSVFMWLITGIITLLAPVEHKVLLEKTCSYGTGMPWDIICSSGTVEIGQISRLMTLVGLVIGLNALCYLLIHCTVNKIQVMELSWVSGGAKYLFNVDSWYYHNTYYLDRSSAVLDGIITWNWGQQIHAFDVKTWRLLPLRRTQSISYDKSFANATKYTIPLDD